MRIYTRQDTHDGWWRASFPAKLENHHEIVFWCIATYKASNWWNDVYYGEVTFRHEDDLLLFLLKWGDNGK